MIGEDKKNDNSGIPTRKKDGNSRRSMVNRKTLLRISVWLIGGWAVVSIIGGNNGLLEYFALQREIVRTRNNISHLKIKLEDLDKKEYRIKHDKAYREELLKTKYRYRGKNEIIIEFVEPDR